MIREVIFEEVIALSIGHLNLIVKHWLMTKVIKLQKRTSSQNGGIGRHTVPPRTTKRRTITNLKTKNNQNCQKIELYGSPTPKELKKKHSPRLVGGVEMGSWSERTSSRATAGGPGPVSWQPADWARWWLADWEVPHSPENKPGGTTGS